MEHNILLVDDDPGLIRVMASVLAGLGQFRFATTGELALRMIEECQPDLLILDAELPGMSGFQICEKVKSDPALKEVPIIFVTSHSDHDFEIKGLEIGASDFIAKPVNAPLMVARVKTQLRIKRMADELRRGATKDALTKLPNRLSFEETLTKEWARGLLYGSEMALLMIEVDHLDTYAERHGHNQVDQVMRKVAQTLGRTCDHPAEYLSRFDRSTFALLMPDTGLQRAQLRANAVMSLVEKLGIAHGGSPISMHVTSSVGIAAYHQGCQAWAAPLDPSGVQEMPACDAADMRLCALSALDQARGQKGGQAWVMDVSRNSAKSLAVEIPPLLIPVDSLVLA